MHAQQLYALNISYRSCMVQLPLTVKSKNSNPSEVSVTFGVRPYKLQITEKDARSFHLQEPVNAYHLKTRGSLTIISWAWTSFFRSSLGRTFSLDCPQHPQDRKRSKCRGIFEHQWFTSVTASGFDGIDEMWGIGRQSSNENSNFTTTALLVADTRGTRTRSGITAR